jgi:hypothetical protein
MSQQTVEQIIGRLVIDKEFRARMNTDRAATLAAFDLTDDERSALANVNLEEFNAGISSLDQRVSKDGLYIKGN